MKRLISGLILATALLLCFGGCSINTGIILTNGNSEGTIDKIFIVPAGSGFVGAEDRLKGSILPGGVRLFDVPTGTWDIGWGDDGNDSLHGADFDIVVIEGQITPVTAINK